MCGFKSIMIIMYMMMMCMIIIAIIFCSEPLGERQEKKKTHMAYDGNGRWLPSCSSTVQTHCKKCPQHCNYTSFDYLIKLRAYRDYGLYCFGATFLNTAVTQEEDLHTTWHIFSSG